MLLALDIGNTNIVAGLFDNTKLVAHWRLSTQRARTADELAAFLKVAFDAYQHDLKDVRGMAIASVVPALTPQAELLAKTYFRCVPVVVNHKTVTGLVNDYENPEEVGADRLVNGLAAWVKYDTAVVIADFGTAITVDAVSKDGHYLGGAIAPGLQIATDALFTAAARLPRVDLISPTRTLGRTTAGSMQAGIVHGYAGLVKELVGRCARETHKAGNERITVVATGGQAELIAPLVPAIQHIEPHLTLEGLRLVWERVQRSRN